MSDSNSSKFKLLWEKLIKEQNINAKFYIHEKTKAEILILESDDTNKMFGIGFTTLPKTKNGIAHILEHSVLCGSKKYPSKEPFLELLKTSQNTFLNAMTYGDKTIYPVASENEKDFHNLSDVYMDAVFSPRITPDILAQEGWHYELNSPEEDLKYKGVVYNEMKGAYSDPERMIANYAYEMLYPDTIYSVEAGGDPNEIPNLTYDEFKNFHATYYHPSNAKIMFYGNGNTDKHLAFAAEYLDQFEYKEVNNKIAFQKEFENPVQKEFSYPAEKSENNDKEFMAVSNWVFIDKLEEIERLALFILHYIIIISEASPMRKALLESGLGEEIIGDGLDMSMQQIIYSIGMKGLTYENCEKCNELIQNTFAQMAENLDVKLLESAINTIEFKLREEDSDNGVHIYQNVLQTWLYGGNPLIDLEFETKIENLREKLNSGEKYFENLIKKYFVNNTHKAIVIMKPDTEMAKRIENEEKTKLEKIKSTFSIDEIQNIIKETERLNKWQQTPDSPEIIAKIPKLKLKDINREIKKIPSHLQKLNEQIEILHHNLPTKGLIYYALVTDLKNIPTDKIPYIGLVNSLLTRIGTKNKNYETLAKEIDTHTGGLNAVPWINNKIGGGYYSKEVIEIKVLANKFEKSIDLLNEIINEVEFTDKARIKQLIQEEYSAIKSTIYSISAYRFANIQSLSGVSEAKKAQVKISGLDYYFFVKEISENFDTKWDELSENLKNVCQRLFNQNKVLINLACEEKDYNEVAKNFEKIKINPEYSQIPEQFVNLETQVEKTFFTLPITINYNAESYHLADLIPNTGLNILAQKIINADHLWNKVRVQGGAYGARGMYDFRSGNLGFVSWRDPNTIKTLEIYRSVGKYLAEGEYSEESLEGTKIGVIGDMDVYQTSEEKATQALEWHLAGVTDEIRQKRRDEIFSATDKEIKDFGNQLNEAISKSPRSTVIIGSKECVVDELKSFEQKKL